MGPATAPYQWGTQEVSGGDRDVWKPGGTQGPKRPPEPHSCRLTSAFQISRDLSLVAKPNMYNTGEGILENVAPATR